MERFLFHASGQLFLRSGFVFIGSARLRVSGLLLFCMFSRSPVVPGKSEMALGCRIHGVRRFWFYFAFNLFRFHRRFAAVVLLTAAPARNVGAKNRALDACLLRHSAGVFATALFCRCSLPANRRRYAHHDLRRVPSDAGMDAWWAERF